MEERKDKKRSVKKVLGGILALVLVAVISIAGTLAYLTTKTGPKKNAFTGSDDIALEVQEPNWTEDDSDDMDTDGETLAKAYTPGLTIPKDPLLKNTTAQSFSEWVAIRVDYYKGSVPTSYTDFAKQSGEESNTTKLIESIAFKTTDWIEVSPSGATYQVYVYKSPLASGTTTSKLFEEVKINNNLAKDGSTYPAFNIYISGAAIKVEASHSSITELDATSMAATGNEQKNIKDTLLSELSNVTIAP